jgi:ABC-type nitrate/sulfonate/bicarbonate transport system substrate-binding protein
MQLTRRSFVTKVVVGIASLPFMKGLSSAQVKGKLGYMKIVDTAAMFMAVEKGFFTAEGLDLEPVPMAGGALIVQGVTSGALQIGMSNVISLYQAHVEGFDLKLVAGAATHVKGPNEGHALIVPQASPLIRAKDLEGRTVAVNTLNNIVHLMAMAWIDKNGADSSAEHARRREKPRSCAASHGQDVRSLAMADDLARDTAGVLAAHHDRFAREPADHLDSGGDLGDGGKHGRDGYFILDAQRRFRVIQMYAGMLALAILGYVLNQLFRLLHRSLLSWHWGLTQRKG